MKSESTFIVQGIRLQTQCPWKYFCYYRSTPSFISYLGRFLLIISLLFHLLTTASGESMTFRVQGTLIQTEEALPAQENEPLAHHYQFDVKVSGQKWLIRIVEKDSDYDYIEGFSDGINCYFLNNFQAKSRAALIERRKNLNQPKEFESLDAPSLPETANIGVAYAYPGNIPTHHPVIGTLWLAFMGGPILKEGELQGRRQPDITRTVTQQGDTNWLFKTYKVKLSEKSPKFTASAEIQHNGMEIGYDGSNYISFRLAEPFSKGYQLLAYAVQDWKTFQETLFPHRFRLEYFKHSHPKKTIIRSLEITGSVTNFSSGPVDVEMVLPKGTPVQDFRKDWFPLNYSFNDSWGNTEGLAKSDEYKLAVMVSKTGKQPPQGKQTKNPVFLFIFAVPLVVLVVLVRHLKSR